MTKEKLFELLNLCTAVVIDETAVCVPSVWELTGDPENEFVYFSWESEGHDYSCILTEGIIDENGAQVRSNDLTKVDLFDLNGEKTTLQFLFPKTLDNS